MKNLTLFILALLMCIGGINAQPMNINFNSGDYPTEWKAIQALEEQALPKSALEKVESLFAKAKKDNNPSQVLKTMIYRAKFTSALEEDGFVKALAKMRTEMEAEAFPTKQILQSMLAEMYAGYLENNVWQFRNRTQTPTFKTDDIRTWTIQQLNDEAAMFHRLALNDDRSKNVPIANFNAVTTEGSDALRPTLFDFLAHRTVDFFADEKSYLAKPSYKFELDTEGSLLQADEFVKATFESKDSTSGKLWALKLLQELTRFHLNDATPEALVNVDLKRLAFAHQHSIVDVKDNLYPKALEFLLTKFSDNPSFVEISLKLAQFHRDKANGWLPNGKKDLKNENKIALELAKTAIKKFPKAYGVKSCRALIDQITEGSFDMHVEEVLAPNKPILAKLNFKNTDSIYYKIIRLYERVGRREFEDDDQRLKYYNNLPFVAKKVVKLPNDGDYNPHSTEIKMDKLPLGMYLILASDNPKFSSKNGGNAHYLTFHVSNIAYFHRSGDTEANQFVVVDRTTGEPMSSVTVEFWENRYDQKLRKDVRLKIGNAVSDDGGFVFPRMPKEKYYTLRFIYGKDTLATGDGYSNYFYKAEKQKYRFTQFFLDRKIYRPSQTVFFKGILIEKTGDESQDIGGLKTAPQIVPNEPVDVTFFDVNHQKIATLSLKTNAFGTFNGSFVAPSSGLLGNMMIQSSKNGSVNLKVEEYKRPKFEAKIEPLEGTFVLEQMIPVIGSAKAFAGNNIDGAMVKYRVVRQARYPYWSWKMMENTEGSQEIAHGETKTDANGKFTIEFKAIADKTIKKEDKPVFDYAIMVDVTDINGETHSAKGSVSIGYTSLLPTIEVGDEMDRQKLKPIQIVAKNLNGQPLAIRGKVKIDLLTSPRRPYITRHWALPDTQVLEEVAFRRDFPLYPFKEEDKEQNWVVKKTVLEKDFETKMTSREGGTGPSVSAGISTDFLPILEFQKYQTGIYRVTVNTTDPTTGEKIDIIKHFMLCDLSDDVVPCNKTFFAWQPKPSFEPTETAKITLGTAAEKLHVLIEEELDGKIIKTEWMDLEAVKSYTVKLTEASRGNHFVHISYAQNNRVSFVTKTLVVPFSNKVLNIEYQTFKDKLEPGSDEEWRIKISGDKKEKVAAEIVAAMYDASLDQFASNAWALNLYNTRNPMRGFDAPTFGEAISTNFYNYAGEGNISEDNPHMYRQFRWFGFNFSEGGRPREMYMARSAAPPSAMDSAPQMRGGEAPLQKAKMMKAEGVAVSPQVKFTPPVVTEGEDKEEAKSDLSTVKTRSNLNETVFFFPELMTDADGNVLIKFKMNEALTKWKFMTLAHTTDLKVGYSERTLVTQKDLMVFPNAPRFLREDDEIEISAKISNLTSQLMQGEAQLQLFDALTMQPVDAVLDNTNASVNFEMTGGLSTSVSWKLTIPIGKVQAITYRIVAKAGSFSDGEENTLPVLTNRLLVTESLPLSVRGGETKQFTLASLKNSGKSKTLTHHALTLEFTQNPAWYAVQALPYLMEYPYECTEQIFSRFYANSLATNVANAHPKIKTVFERWKNTDVKALQSNLSKNQALKTALLEETPWVLAAQNEEVQKKNIGLLFDLNKMSNESTNALRKMSERQLSNGGFAWFPGGRDSWFITQYITEGFGHLTALGVDNQDVTRKNMVDKSLVYCDERFNEEYAELEKRVGKQQAKWEDDNLSSLCLHYLYTQSFFPKHKNPNDKSVKYYLGQAEKFWTKRGIYEQALIALAMKRSGKGDVTNAIVASLKERALNSDELGMYWKSNWGYNWNEQPIETQALMIELFNEISDAKSVDNLKIWLLKNKQTNAWKTTKATASAVYALLKTGDNWLLEDSPIDISVGGEKLNIAEKDKEAGTGYFKTAFKQADISAKKGDIEVKNPNKVVSWGALYWQYFEDLDKIKDFKETPLTIVKQLFKQENGDKGLEMKPIANDLSPDARGVAALHIGDKIKVRIELRVDRPMEFVHMKDMRAAGFEPVNVLSQYKYQGGLGYYESTKDAATNFFFDYLPRGTYVFEYVLVVNNKGDMSNGITTIQCMYAPEFTSHSAGVRVKVK